MASLTQREFVPRFSKLHLWKFGNPISQTYIQLKEDNKVDNYFTKSILFTCNDIFIPIFSLFICKFCPSVGVFTAITLRTGFLTKDNNEAAKSTDNGAFRPLAKLSNKKTVKVTPLFRHELH